MPPFDKLTARIASFSFARPSVKGSFWGFGRLCGSRLNEAYRTGA